MIYQLLYAILLGLVLRTVFSYTMHRRLAQSQIVRGRISHTNQDIHSPTQAEVDVPGQFQPALNSFADSYRRCSEGNDSNEDTPDINKCVDSLFTEVSSMHRRPYDFCAYQHAIREPFDYYKWSNKLINPFLDMKSSTVVGLENFGFVSEKLAKGDNVVLICNQQTIFDAKVFQLLLASMGLDSLAEKCIFISDPGLSSCALTAPLLLGSRSIRLYLKQQHRQSNSQSFEESLEEDTASVGNTLTSSKANSELIMNDAMTEINAMGFGAMEMIFHTGGRLLVVPPAGRPDFVDPESNQLVVPPFHGKILDVLDLLREKTVQNMHFLPVSICSHHLLSPFISSSLYYDHQTPADHYYRQSFSSIRRAGAGIIAHQPLQSAAKDGFLQSGLFDGVHDTISQGVNLLDNWIVSRL